MDPRSGNMALLRRSPFFCAAGPEAMAELLRLSFTQLLPRGTVVFEQGEQPDFLHMLLAGSIGLQARADGKDKTIIEIFGGGEVFLAPAVVLRRPYLASAVALTEVRVLMIPADAFRDAIRRDLALADASIELLSRHWRLMVEQVVDLKLRSAESRVARFLARRVSEEAGAGTAELPEPRNAIAARLGMTPETFSRALAALEQKGLLRRGATGPSLAERRALDT
jgi:CRP/FNR family transcriptional activator FtrB